ncbi:MCP four helix bundle domain-containing protein [Dyella ginsengisoli]|uniref:MCP four helix bundle domain-containing protein n=1 Tax=Dyella ginsengisoli TaxID=363848 RepID=A0ABW8JX84_9GAMM
MHFPQWSIKVRLIVTLGTLAALLATVGVMGIADLSSSNAALRDMHANKLIPAMSLARGLDLLGGERTSLHRALGARDPDHAATFEKSLRSDDGDLAQLLAKFHAAELSPEENAIGHRLDADYGDFRNAMNSAAKALDAKQYDLAAQTMDGAGEKSYTSLRGDIGDLFTLQDKIAKAAYGADEQRASRSAKTTIAAIAFGLALSGAIGFQLVRSISRSLAEAMRVADNIAGGKLNNRIERISGDEVGRLLQSLAHMDAKLAEVVADVRAGSESVSTAARQIAQGNDDLSQRTQEQASSLEETAASMEEMTATVKQNAENASHANQLARGAREQAEHGGAVVSKTVEAMGAISASSQKIADIVGLIDEIAFQTNLLALNAAVEAARAGDQGRGFAVVASEVRNLAQRSALAAKEIKTLIGDSVERVKMGSGLVDESGRSLAAIVESIKKVTDIVAEIAAASTEQSAGIEQVNMAVTQMDEVTQQNAALVEEAASASRAMEEQAMNLRRQVAYFHTEEIQEASVTPTHDKRTSRAHRAHAHAGDRKLASARPHRVEDKSVWKEF